MVSVIIVNYHVSREIFECIGSIYASKPKTPFEIIVVDNDEEKTIEKELSKKFPKVVYVPNKNKGFGEGNNVGAQHSKGKYLFFLNPDTKLLNNVIDDLTHFLNCNNKAAIAAPILYEDQNKKIPLQGARELNPTRAVWSLSMLSKIFPNNRIKKKYYLSDWNKEANKETDVVPGTAFVIRRSVFEEQKGFDEKFFLYFEEFDLCKRVKSKGWKIYMLPSSKVFHHWGASTKTKSREYITDIFLKSRFYYFKKHFGIVKAIIIEIILRFGKKQALVASIILLILFILLMILIYN